MLWWFAQTTLIAGALAALATLASRWKRFGAEARHALWLIVLIKLAIPPVIAWPWLVPDAWPASLAEVERSPVALPGPAPLPTPIPVVDPDPPAWQPLPIKPRVAAAVVVEPDPEPELRVRLVEPPSPEAFAPTEPRVAEAPMPEVADLIASEPRTEVLAPPPRVSPPPAAAPAASVIFDWHRNLGDLRLWLLGLWLVGSVVVVIRRGVRVVRFHRSLSNTSPGPEWLVEETRAIGERVGVRPPPLALTSKVATPLLWCLGRPRLILPEGLVKRLEADRWAGILAHELAHLARRDHWVVRLELLVEAVWWWNPLFWHVRRKLHEEAELACDARVVRALPDRRFAYAEALVDVCEHLARAAIPPPALGVGGGGGGASRSLEGRLLMILRDPIPGRPSRAASLVAWLLVALALPAWTLGQQQPEPTRLDPVPATAPTSAAPSPPDEPKPSPPQPLTPGTKPSAAAAEATVATIAKAQDDRFEALKSLSFRYVVVGRERKRHRIFGNGFDGGMGGMSGMSGGMGGLGGMMSLPPQPQSPTVFPNALTTATSSTENRVHVEVADVVLGSGQVLRLDHLEAREQPPVPAPGQPAIFPWDRRYVARESLGVTALEMAWDQPGAVPFRWLAGNRGVGVGDSLAVWMFGGSSTDNDRGLDPLDPRPANVLGLLGSSIWFVAPTYANAYVSGFDLIEGQEVVRLAWIGTRREGVRGIAWYAPQLGFALVRCDATVDPSLIQAPFHNRLTWRKQASDFVKVGESWLPRKVTYEESEADAGGGEPVYRNELKVAFENFQLDPATPPGGAARAKLVVQGLDDKTGQFTALPPELPGGLVDRLKKAVQESPFGPPVLAKVAEPPAGFVPVLIQTFPLQTTNQQPRPALLPAPQPKDAAKSDPGIIAQPNPNFKDPIPVVEPKQTAPIPVKDPGDQAMIDQATEARFRADPDVTALATNLKEAQNKLDAASRMARNGDDPAVRAARKKLDQLQARYNELWGSKSSQFRKLAAREITEAREAVDLLLIRRERKAADLRKAEAQRRLARTVVARNSAYLKKDPNFVSREEVTKAESELAIAEAEVASWQSDLDEADLLVTQARRRLEVAPGAKDPKLEANAIEIGPLQDRRFAQIEEVARAAIRLDGAKRRVARNLEPPQNGIVLSADEIKKAEAEVEKAEKELAIERAALKEIDSILSRASKERTSVEPDGPKAAGSPQPEPVDPDAIAIMQARRDARAAELEQAKAQKQMAVALVNRNAALIKKNPQYVSREDAIKADAELVFADAEVARKGANLAEAEILLKQSNRAGGSLAKPTEPSAVPALTSASTLPELRDVVELMEVQLLGKQAELRGAEFKAQHPSKTPDVQDRETALGLARAAVEQKKIEVQEYEVRLKQARRRVDAEEARLKREVERAREELSQAETLFKSGAIDNRRVTLVRSHLDDLMLQLASPTVPTADPAPAGASGPQPPDVPRPVLAVKLIGQEKRQIGQTNEYRLLLSNPSPTAATGVKVVVSLPTQGGKLSALPTGAKFVPQSRTLVWSYPRVEPDQSISLNFAYQTTTPGLYRASVEVTSDEGEKAADAFSTEVEGVATLDFKITQTARVVNVGELMFYDFTIKNTGTKAATEIQLTGKLSMNFKLLKHFDAAKIKGNMNFKPETGEFVFPMIEQLAPGETTTVSLEVEPTQSGPAGCRASLDFAEMAHKQDPVEGDVIKQVSLEDVISTTITAKPAPETEPKK